MNKSSTQATADVILKDGSLHVSGELTFFNVMNVYEKSVPLLAATNAEANIDFSSLTASDSAGLALLMEWVKLGKKWQKAIRFSHVPADLTALAKVAGMGRWV